MAMYQAAKQHVDIMDSITQTDMLQGTDTVEDLSEDSEVEQSEMIEMDEALSEFAKKDLYVHEFSSGLNGFKCQICVNIRLLNTQDANAHVASKGHKLNLKKSKKAKWTPEMIAKRKDKNKRKREKRFEKKKASDIIKATKKAKVIESAENAPKK